MSAIIRLFLYDEDGATAIEYGLIIALLSLAIVGGIGHAADKLEYMWGDNNSRLNQGLNAH
jgi:pilus assembly protein Flp/PilA